MSGARRFLAGAILMVAALPCPARSPRTGDLAFSFTAGAAAAPAADEFRDRAVASISHETYWSAASALRGTVGFLDLAARPGSGRGDVSALYLTANVSRNWLRGPVFPYVTGGVGLYAVEEISGPGRDRDDLEVGVNGGLGVEFRLRDDLGLRLQGLLHALTGDGPSTVAVGSLGLTFYY